MTREQFELLQDKIALWRRSATEGAMDLRDYNKRAAEALTAAGHDKVALCEFGVPLAKSCYDLTADSYRAMIDAALAPTDGDGR